MRVRSARAPSVSGGAAFGAAGTREAVPRPSAPARPGGRFDRLEFHPYRNDLMGMPAAPFRRRAGGPTRRLGSASARRRRGGRRVHREPRARGPSGSAERRGHRFPGDSRISRIPPGLRRTAGRKAGLGLSARDGRRVYGTHGRVERRVEFLVGLVDRQALGERAGKTGDDAAVQG